MTKIYEALEQANENWIELRNEAAAGPRAESPHSPVEDRMISLYQNVLSMLPESKCLAIQFTGSQRGEGTSALAREMAKAVSKSLHKSVLLIDQESPAGRKNHAFGVRGALTIEDIIHQGKNVKDVLQQVGKESLYVSYLSGRRHFTAQNHDLKKLDQVFENFKTIFDLLIVDTPPVASSPDSLILTRYTDGVVLVVEAESTRTQVVEKTLEHIRGRGGNVLGVVLNKRRYVIPEFLYRWL